MLVLSRKVSDSIIIHDDIEIIVVEIRGDKVRLGIKAPSSVPVHRKEVYEAIQRANASVTVEVVPVLVPSKLESLGQRADFGLEDAQIQLADKSRKLGLDYESFETWTQLEEAIKKEENENAASRKTSSTDSSKETTKESQYPGSSSSSQA